ncbi:hypothetical protein PVAND_006197 [Polypedilum vanderplanki]|uniref:Uncharacterized protein n=1 Tax=Polypedilum vanderplanki TaxID=319348 RepID=A0A9J6C3F9_POLVA|nr:hypothetical protein PVAND_006197 [Polypedilum vanderplanki]
MIFNNSSKLYQFVILTIIYPIVSSIKVDFGTRGGPIIPPPPTTPSPPLVQPYRQPAPVWEDHSNDIPNPRPFIYQLPTPSRSRENTVNIFDPNYKQPVYTPNNNNPHVTHQQQPVNNFQSQFGYSLVPVYIPNEGYKYFVVVPANKWKYLNTNHIDDDFNALESQKYDKYDKYNGKYNAKLKKYKAYEKFLKPTQQQQNYQQYQQGTDRPIKSTEQWNKQ